MSEVSKWIYFTLLFVIFAGIIQSEICDNEPVPCFDDQIQRNIIASAGTMVVLSCVVRNIEPSNILISWWKEGALTEISLGNVLLSHRYKLIVKKPNNWTLIIKNVKLTDAGNYICQINFDKVIELVFNVNVTKETKSPNQNDESLSIHKTTELSKTDLNRQHVIKLNGATKLTKGQNLRLTCIVQSKPIEQHHHIFSTIYWWHNNKHIQSMNKKYLNVNIRQQWIPKTSNISLTSSERFVSHIDVKWTKSYHIAGYWSCTFGNIIGIVKDLWETENVFVRSNYIKVTVKRKSVNSTFIQFSTTSTVSLPLSSNGFLVPHYRVPFIHRISLLSI